MQAQQASKTRQFIARLGRRNLIWGGIFGVLMLAGTVTWLWSYRGLPTASGRMANASLPWERGPVTIEELTGCWRSSKGNARMELRAAYYPAATITLGEVQGNGMLYVRFTDSNGRQMGDILSLPYRDGAFVPRNELNIHAEGRKAEVHIEAGLNSKDELTLMQLNENLPLWRVALACLPEGADQSILLGFVTIPMEEEGGAE